MSGGGTAPPGLRVAVVQGGRSSEAEVSRSSGGHAAEALRGLGHRVTTLECDDELWEALRAGGFDVAFLALHGQYGEDGTVQGVCELLGLPYTGSGVMATSLAFDKAMAKQVFRGAGMCTPEWTVLPRSLDPAAAAAALRAAAAQLGLPLVVKPNRGGSTIGLSIVDAEAGLEEAWRAAARHDDVLCERCVRGMEVTIGVLGDPPAALPTLEIVSHRPLYDYQAKYTAEGAEHIIPARLDAAGDRAATEAALGAHRALGCRDISRVDLIVDSAGTPWVLEVNTIPGLTPISLLPDAARAAGIDFAALCGRLVAAARARRQPRGGSA